jgi:hypothetical protein
VQTKDYSAEEYREDHELEENDPGVLLRGELSQVEAPDDTDALDELLHTANETNLLDDVEITAQDALTVWRLVELSRRLSPDRLEMLRM